MYVRHVIVWHRKVLAQLLLMVVMVLVWELSLLAYTDWGVACGIIMTDMR